MLLGATLAIGGGLVALVLVIVLFVMLGDPMADTSPSPRSPALRGFLWNDRALAETNDKPSLTP